MKTKIDKTTAWVLFLLTGWSYGQFKQYGLQVFYYVMVLLFIIMSANLSLFCMLIPAIWNITIIASLNKSIDEWNSTIV